MTLRLASEQHTALVVAARTVAPREACGLLVGRRVVGGIDVCRIAPVENRAEADDAFAIDPLVYLDVESGARRDGLDVVGVWHSHPSGGAIPSRRDLDGAWPDHVQVIVDPRTGHIRAWRLVDDAFVEDDVGP